MVKWLSEVTKDDIKDATRIEAMTYADDGKSDPKTLWICHGKLPEGRKGPGQPFPMGNTLVVRLLSEQDLLKLQAMVSEVAGRDITKDD